MKFQVKHTVIKEFILYYFLNFLISMAIKNLGVYHRLPLLLTLLFGTHAISSISYEISLSFSSTNIGCVIKDEK